MDHTWCLIMSFVLRIVLVDIYLHKARRAYLLLKNLGKTLSLTVIATVCWSSVLAAGCSICSHQSFGPLLFCRTRRLTYRQRLHNVTFPLLTGPQPARVGPVKYRPCFHVTVLNCGAYIHRRIKRYRSSGVVLPVRPKRRRHVNWLNAMVIFDFGFFTLCASSMKTADQARSSNKAISRRATSNVVSTVSRVY
jgi:hypothetical protein